MGALLYATVWISLILFALAELARDRTSRSWPTVVSAAGLALMVTHILIAMDARHGWQHASAIAATAEQTRSVYGLNWGGGVYVNYAFVTAWALTFLRAVPGYRGAGVPAVRALVRAAFLIIIFNAAVVFAAGWRRAIGVVVVAALAYAWWPRARAHS